MPTPMPSSPDATALPLTTPPRRSKKFLILAFLLLLGAALVWGLLKQRGEQTPQPLKPPTYLALDTMVVNLSGGEKIAQIGVTLELTNEQTLDQLKLFLPSLRAKILLLLTQRSAEELLRFDGKEKLSADIGLEISRYLSNTGSTAPSGQAPPNSAVPTVIFSSFMVQ